ncbi:MAG: hypothetical protein ABIC91_01050 [Nanoarchaeota archaeon]|nr:hypothetical protein [Nanoarchaeota archaeon]MBU1030917.1 hypothetical protein [Nanoarchaeota archaeon]MBU1850690.1 hypothetical protein [Nanoarchaeota archaeon]
MSESGDYNPGPWRGHDFGSARKTYDAHVGRSYSVAKSQKKTIKDVVEPTLKTNSKSPLVIACDVTGSMGSWPATIFSKLPYLDLEGKEYLGPSMEISFAAVGDAYCDDYPLQVRPFAGGKDLENRLKELIIEGGGGGTAQESYELAAMYYANNVDMPRAKNKPIFIYIGDEGFYDFVNSDQVKKHSYVTMSSRTSGKKAFENLKKKYSVYLIRKPYETGRGNGLSVMDQRIYDQWAEVLGADHITMLPEASRVVDVIFGILAKETERIDYFHDELKGRQTDAQVSTVLKSLKPIHGGLITEDSRLIRGL